MSTFTGTLRQISPDHLNPSGEAILRTCAPRFLPATDEELTRLIEEQRKHLSPHVKHVLVEARPHRRFSGDMFADRLDAHRLDVGSYYSVCQRSDGWDAGTLAQEINAYRSSAEDFYVFFVDCLHPEIATQFGLPPAAHIMAVISQPDEVLERLPTDAPDELREALRRAAVEQRPLTVTLGSVFGEVRIESVLDLRTREAQRWLFDTYVASTFIPSDASDFVDILPELLQPTLGGSDGSNMRLQAIGADLRSAGVSALIYPSARNDVGVKYAGDEIEIHRGWNMVVYGERVPREHGFVDVGGWATDFWNGIECRKQVNAAGEITEWYVAGLELVNLIRYDREMQRRGILPG